MIKIKKIVIFIAIIVSCFIMRKINVKADGANLEFGPGFACNYFAYYSNRGTGSGAVKKADRKAEIQLRIQKGKIVEIKYSNYFLNVNNGRIKEHFDIAAGESLYESIFFLTYVNNEKASCPNGDVLNIWGDKALARSSYFDARFYASDFASINNGNGWKLTLRDTSTGNHESYKLLDGISYSKFSDYKFQSYYTPENGIIECPDNLLYLNNSLHKDFLKDETSFAYLMYDDDDYYTYENGFKIRYYEEDASEDSTYYHGCLANGDKLHYSTKHDGGYNLALNYRLLLKESFTVLENGSIKFDNIDVGGNNVDENCNTKNGLITPEFIEFLDDYIFKPIKIVAPILLFLFTSFDFAKAIFANDEKAILKAWQSLIKRATAVICLFLMSYIINLILTIFLSNMTDIDSITCGIR